MDRPYPTLVEFALGNGGQYDASIIQDMTVSELAALEQLRSILRDIHTQIMSEPPTTPTGFGPPQNDDSDTSATSACNMYSVNRDQFFSALLSPQYPQREQQFWQLFEENRTLRKFYLNMLVEEDRRERKQQLLLEKAEWAIYSMKIDQ